MRRSWTTERGLRAAGVTILLLLGIGTAGALAGEDGAGDMDSRADLAQELTNPLASLITIPIQINGDRRLGLREEGERLQANLQPVYPFTLNESWNLISRTIVPVIYQDDVVPGEGSQFGLGDINVSLFFSPRRARHGVIWGVGPVLLLPTATDSLLGSEKWGGGPTAVALSIRGRWTFGALGNHVWSFAGDEQRADISSTFLQPFVAYTWPSAWTLSAQSESTYDWKRETWSVPLNVGVSRLVKIGRLPVSLQAGAGYWLDSSPNGPEGWRYRVQANLVLPKRR